MAIVKLMKKVVLTIQKHKTKERLFADFPFDKELNLIIKSIPGSSWSNSKKQWHFNLNKQVVELLRQKLTSIASLDISLLEKQWKEKEQLATRTKLEAPRPSFHDSYPSQETDPSHFVALQAYVEFLRLKNYSTHTIRNYKNWFMVFLNYFPDRKPSTITKYEIMDFLVTYRKSEKWSSTTQNQLINAIKFFYEKLLNKKREVYDLPRAKKEYKLPAVFSEDELKRIVLATENLKHRSILCLAYSAGLRISEIVNLKIEDVDSSRMVITLRGAKGKKDRQVMLSSTLLDLLRNYFRSEKQKPKIWLFEGQYGGQYSTRSIEEVMKYAKKKAGVKKKGSIHAIRHSFATHLLEAGTDIFTIKELLGHNSIRTTGIYAHVSKKHISKVQSPLDKLGLK